MSEESYTAHLPVRFQSAGQCAAKPGWIHPERTLDSSVLILVKSGRFGIHIGEENFIAGPGQVLLLPAGIPHGGFPTGDGEEPVYSWAHFEDGSPVSGQTARLERLCTDLRTDARDRAANTFHQLISEGNTRGGGLICDYLLSLLLLELTEEQETSRSVLSNRVQEYIRLHCCEKLTLADLNRVFGYSGDYLSRLFHEDMHVSFRQYIHSLRIRRAKELLADGSATVSWIAEECGYSNTKFFSTVFLKCEGVTPSAYRAMYGSQHRNNA